MARRKTLEVRCPPLASLQSNIESIKKEYAQRGVKIQIEISESTIHDDVWIITVWGL